MADSASTAPQARDEAADHGAVARPGKDASAPKSASQLWGDGFGRVGIRAAQALLIIAISVVAVFALLQIKLLVIPVLIALILAAAISPFVNMLKRRGINDGLSTVIAFVTLLAALGAIFTVIFFSVRSQWDDLVQQASTGLDQLQEFVLNGPIPVEEDQITQARDAIIEFATSSQVRSGAITGISVVGEFLTGAALLVVILFFFLKDGQRIWSFLTSPFKGERATKLQRVGTKSQEVLGGYIRGTSVVALVDAVFIGVALFILQVPLALPLAMVVFIGAFIPIVGATMAGVLAALVALVANGPLVALIVIAVVIAVNQLEGNLLQPVVMGKSLQLHALVILLALTAGTLLAGIVGAVLSVPLTAVTWSIIKIWFSNEAPKTPATEPAPYPDVAAESTH